MKLPFNLRSDLHGLDDAELAERVELISEMRERLGLKPRWSDPIFMFRGPVRHPFAYRLQHFMLGTNSAADAAVAAMVAASPKISNWLIRRDRTANVYMLNCELLDLQDELERRVRMRERSTP